MGAGFQDRGLIGRADLLRALRKVSNSEVDEILVADALGFGSYTDTTPSARLTGHETTSTVSVEARKMEIVSADRLAVPFLMAGGFERTGNEGEAATVAPSVIGYGGFWRGRPQRCPIAPPLTPWRDLRPVLTQMVRDVGAGSQIDVDRAIDIASRAEIVERIPRREVRRWPLELTVIVDRSPALVPFWRDQRLVLIALKAFAHDTKIRVLAWFPGELSFSVLENEAERSVAPEDLDGPVLVLGDLGAHDADVSDTSDIWGRLGSRLGPKRALALSPGPRPERRLESDWTICSWATHMSGPERPRASLEADARRLVMLLAPAVRVEPGLLRTIRLKCLPHAEPAIESLAWRSEAFMHGSSVAARFRPEHAIVLRRRFRKEDQAVRRAVLEAMRAWRAGCHETVWYEEIVNLDEDSLGLLPSIDVDDAKGYFATHAAGRSEDIDIDTRVWLTEAQSRADLALDDVDFRMAVHKAIGEGDTANPGKVGIVSIWHDGADLKAVAGLEGQGSLVGHLRSMNGKVTVEPAMPEWASAAGRDAIGRWIEFTWKGVVQRLRWVEPGAFEMGSPESEDGRYSDEGPLTEITFREGFWLFDTAVPQALWSAFMENNPSSVTGEQLPVTHVSWHDAIAFIERLNAELPGIDLRLPAESEWEYACRAGTVTATAFGDVAEKAKIHFDADALIHVKAKKPNAWGFYQMHGNVWEWCADAWSDSHEGADVRGLARQASQQDQQVQRVIRGGSWDGSARYVRAAYRHFNGPGVRDDGLGFRCARGQASDGPGRSGTGMRAGAFAAEPRSRSGRTPTEHRVRLGRPPVRLTKADAPFVLRSDLERLDLQRIVRADCSWADALARDRFGLNAEVKVTDVRTCLRWIPPGRFKMGSSREEEGRSKSEGPETEITFSEGFWLMDTPVTQALWSAVMGENPSRFQDLDRPVERVSWHDAQTFIGRLNERVSDLHLRLPSESEWEYACRAGTEFGTYAGHMEIEGQLNAPVLDAIAWYGGNSGVEYDLVEGEDSSEWPQKQYPHTRAGTRKVRLKAPNAFGCYDMLGNVWEWCADAWSDSHEGADAWGLARQASQQDQQVIRGGSWGDYARSVRAASRSFGDPDERGDYLGFRCARGQASSGMSTPEAQAREDAARPAEPVKPASGGFLRRIFGRKPAK